MRGVFLAPAQRGNEGGGGGAPPGPEVVKELAAAADHLQQTAAGVMILLVLLEVARQQIDAGGKQGNLHFGGAGITGLAGKLGNDLGLVDLFRHLFHLIKIGV